MKGQNGKAILKYIATTFTIAFLVGSMIFSAVTGFRNKDRINELAGKNEALQEENVALQADNEKLNNSNQNYKDSNQNLEDLVNASINTYRDTADSVLSNIEKLLELNEGLSEEDMKKIMKDLYASESDTKNLWWKVYEVVKESGNTSLLEKMDLVQQSHLDKLDSVRQTFIKRYISKTLSHLGNQGALEIIMHEGERVYLDKDGAIIVKGNEFQIINDKQVVGGNSEISTRNKFTCVEDFISAMSSRLLNTEGENDNSVTYDIVLANDGRELLLLEINNNDEYASYNFGAYGCGYVIKNKTSGLEETHTISFLSQEAYDKIEGEYQQYFLQDENNLE